MRGSGSLAALALGVGKEMPLLSVCSTPPLFPNSSSTLSHIHINLQYGKIMMDEEFKQVTIIDYEYASFNPVAYDLANHFCEMAADYHTQTPHILDFNEYPGEKLIEAEVEIMLQLIEKYALASHLLWGLWGIILPFTISLFNTIDSFHL
ncbi:probable choline kinase 2 [Zingiber officinale]|uniref:probable choline kinase 2 n=1 Tax=Zingiber officinale TaxID=94328 RepID=UPI001C4B3468|nr:probable choline kinase 2 [Zingiber officinale]